MKNTISKELTDGSIINGNEHGFMENHLSNFVALLDEIKSLVDKGN